MNEEEALAVAAACGLPAGTPVMAARYLAAGRKVAVIVTMGAAGAIAFQGPSGWLVPTLNLKPESVVDTTGAGDAFVGVLAAAIDGGLSFDATLSAASVGGASSASPSPAGGTPRGRRPRWWARPGTTGRGA